MELNLLRSDKIVFRDPSSIRHDREGNKVKVKSINKIDESSYALTFYPVIDERSTASYQTVCTKPFRENSINLLFGDTELAKVLKKRQSWTNGTTHLTLTSSNDGRLTIETKGGTPEKDKDNDDVDILKGLLNLQETLPPNSIEFKLSFRDFREFLVPDKSDYEGEQAVVERGVDFNEKGLKLKRNEVGSASLEMTDIHFPGEIWWKRWCYKWSRFSGFVTINLRLDTAAVAELYKRHFGGGASSATEVGTAFDMVILVGGNKDKEKAIKCHKAILSEMSPVLAAMFQIDMLEAKEGTWEIVDFSEAVIRAWMEFAYRRNLEVALRSSEMTLELLQFADKYEMKELMDILLHIIWSMPCSWFSMDVALKLFFFAKNAGEDLAVAEEKAWKALKWYAETRHDELIESTESAHFLCENSRAMMELVVLLLNKCD